MVKKMLVFLFVAFILCSGLCEDYDFSTMSDMELLDFRVKIEQEIADRGVSLNSYYYQDVPYIVGKDIEPGEYVITCVKNTISALTGGKFQLWNEESDYYSDSDSPKMSSFIVLGQSIRLRLDEGALFTIQGGVMSFNLIE